MQNLVSRRKAIQCTAAGIAGLSLPFVSVASPSALTNSLWQATQKPYPAYPSLDPELVSEMVGKSHFDLSRVRQLVKERPELARATWEWKFGDFESAIGAASHVGRRDIIQFLINQGANPDIFTFATLGSYEIVKGMVELFQGIQRTLGPHGISLLNHARAGLRMEDKMSLKEVENSKKLIGYLEDLGDAEGPQYQDVSEAEKNQYLGDYRYGDGKTDGFSIQLNMRKMLSLGVIGEFGGALNKVGDDEFTYAGTPSVQVTFQKDNDSIKSITVTTPGSVIVAKKVK
ncbi:MAG: hypothetical protein ABJG47_14865 [Ekhidna sp.]